MFLAERCGRRVQRFSSAGRHLETFGQGSLTAPTLLAVDPAGTVFVSDHHRVVRFARRGAVAAPAPVARGTGHNALDLYCRNVAQVDGGN